MNTRTSTVAGCTRALAATVAGVTLGALAAPAHAAVTVGSRIDHLEQTSQPCPDRGGCAVVAQTLPGCPTTAPFRAAIVRWRVRGTGTFLIAPVSYRGDDTGR